MFKQIVFHPDVAEDIKGAYLWYEKQLLGLGDRFLLELEETKDATFCEIKYTGYSCARITANIFKQWNLSHNIVIPIFFNTFIHTPLVHLVNY